MEEQIIDYTVNWETAPDWALFHHFQKNQKGIWKGMIKHPDEDYFIHISGPSDYKIPENGNYLESITLRPQNTKKTGKYMPYQIYGKYFKIGWEDRIKEQFYK
jgi:hypothetical protein